MSAVTFTRFASFTATLALGLGVGAGTALAQGAPPSPAAPAVAAPPPAQPAPPPPQAAPPPLAPSPMLEPPPPQYPGYAPPPPQGPVYYPGYPPGPVYEPPPPPARRPSGPKSDLVMLSYNTAVGLGKTHDFAPDFSFLGFSFDWRARVTDNFWPGLTVAWQVLYGKESKTYTFNNTTFTGTIATSLNVFPLLATANYYFMTDPLGVRPYAGIGVGAYAAEHRIDVGISTISDTSWHFGFAPELGVVLPTGSVPVIVATKFNYAFASGGWDQLMYWNFNVGVEL